MGSETSSEAQSTSVSLFDQRPPPRKADLEAGLIAIFPLIKPSHPQAAVGVLLKYSDELDALMPHPEVTISAADTLKFDNAAYWVDEISIHTMSSTDLDAYSPFMDNPNGDAKYWCNLIKHHLAPAHEAFFREFWIYMRSWKDRKFRRLPVEHMTNQCKTALFEFQGTKGTPDEMLPSPYQKKNLVWTDPERKGGKRSSKEYEALEDEEEFDGLLTIADEDSSARATTGRSPDSYDDIMGDMHRTPADTAGPPELHPLRRSSLAAPPSPTASSSNESPDFCWLIRSVHSSQDNAQQKPSNADDVADTLSTLQIDSESQTASVRDPHDTHAASVDAHFEYAPLGKPCAAEGDQIRLGNAAVQAASVEAPHDLEIRPHAALAPIDEVDEHPPLMTREATEQGASDRVDPGSNW